MSTIEEKIERLRGNAKGFYQNEIKKLHNKLDIAIANFEREFGKVVPALTHAEIYQAEANGRAEATTEAEKIAEEVVGDAEEVEEKSTSWFDKLRGK